MTQINRSVVTERVPGGAPATPRLQRLGLLVGLAALAISLLGAFQNPEQFWQSYLLAYLFWLEIGLGCLGLVMLHHLAGGRWSALSRRVLETGAMTLPLMALLFVPLLWGLATLYPWTDPAYLLHSEALQQKSLYLNLPFFLARALIYFAIWLALAYLLNRWSLAQDLTGEEKYTRRMVRLSALGMILYVLTATFAAYDWMMSLEPEWFSSIYGLLFIAGQAVAALALAIIGLALLSRREGADQDWRQPFNDLGNLMLGFVMIWAYFSFSQFLIIWSANIPEEAIWYYHRSQGGWQNVGLFLIGVHFVLPFLLLLSRVVKRQAQRLMVLAMLIFVVRWVDLFWLIVPAFHPEALHWHWLDLAILAAMGGGWVALFSWKWRKKSPLPLHDPRL
jgi:hypothetical protein